MALPKFSREQFYSIGSVNGTPQLDFLSFRWIQFSEFIRFRRVRFYRVPQHQECNLPLISFQFYNDRSLWWIIAIANNILNPISEVVVGTELKIPTLEDVESFYQTILSRRRSAGESQFPRNVA